jgi:hypothetical protein
MSSAVLYLAIVAVWGIVLVPMWLRRDGEGISRRLLRRGEDATEEDFSSASESEDEELADYETVEPPAFEHLDAERAGSAYTRPVDERATRQARRRRAAVIARRRRRTLGCTLLMIASVVTVATGLTPWWFVAPPAVLLTGHLSLLRVAVQMDVTRRVERQAAARRAIAAHQARETARLAQAEREAEEAARTAEVIELPSQSHEEVYDQYTDRRAVGD